MMGIIESYSDGSTRGRLDLCDGGADRLQWVGAIGHPQRMSGHFAMGTPIDIMTRSLVLLHIGWWSELWLYCVSRLPLEPEHQGRARQSERDVGGS